MANQYTKQKLISEQNRKEIFWNIVNSSLAGVLVFLGAMTNGGFTWQALGAAGVASGVVAVTQFYNYWKKQESEYCEIKIFSFVKVC